MIMSKIKGVDNNSNSSNNIWWDFLYCRHRWHSDHKKIVIASDRRMWGGRKREEAI